MSGSITAKEGLRGLHPILDLGIEAESRRPEFATEHPVHHKLNEALEEDRQAKGMKDEPPQTDQTGGSVMERQEIRQEFKSGK